jgi:hypothetical protein
MPSNGTPIMSSRRPLPALSGGRSSASRLAIAGGSESGDCARPASRRPRGATRGIPAAMLAHLVRERR